ncbi:solute carrier family 24 (sodium/potassium/calcium exchanger), member 6 [Entomortierella parvispora]|uniref:Solute carrier family 24 (Sodium/potassium/calcium exchanger), member 6 n=1 Tax=Entomortierella parvispora TaxID=205924 RepID=A0A9P3HEF1_9FUNG|nr:solute carrier family 24 (sodium/potassium/calcium exchanger), member 6 [Entomortierella parvispora]
MASGTRLFYLLISLFCFSQILTRVLSSNYHAQRQKHSSSSLLFKRLDYEEDAVLPDMLCEAVWDYPDRCSFAQEYCTDAGLINYFELYFCTLQSAPALAIIIMIVWIIFLFALVGVAASDFFCPNLNTIAKQLHLSESMTGVTFLAFGNASPDIFSTFSAMSAGSGSLAIGEVVGAASLISSVVVGAMAIIKPFKVNKGSFLRDTTFFTGCIVFTLYMVLNKEITLAHSIVLVVAYIAYVIIAVVGHRRDRTAEAEEIQAAGITVNIVEDSQDAVHKVDQGPPSPPSSRESSSALLVLPRPTHSRSSSLNRIPALVISHNTGVESVLDHASRVSTDGSADIDLTVRHSHHSTHSNDHRTASTEICAAPNTDRSGISRLIPILFPTLHDWHDKTFIGKAMAVASIPIVLVLQLTLPVVDLDAEENEVSSSAERGERDGSALTQNAGGPNGWNRTATMIQLVIAPVFLAAVVTSVVGSGYLYIFGALALGVVLSALVGYFSTDTKPPRGHKTLAFVGFLVAMAWIFLVANEVVGILQALGMILKVSDAILGLTVFAMGNSLGDLVANITIARMGFPRMAFSACFGGPLLNMLLGVGVSGIYVTVQTSDPILLEAAPTLIVSLVGVLLTMVAALVVVPRSGYELTRWWGWFLLGVYAVCLVANIVIEVKLPKPEL